MPLRRRRQPRNIASFVARAVVGHELADDGVVSLLVPRFRARWMQWLQGRLRKPYIRVKLDELGSATWLLIDGRRTVTEIGEELHRKFGAKIEPLSQRLGFFIGLLRRNKFIELEEPQETPAGIEPE